MQNAAAESLAQSILSITPSLLWFFLVLGLFVAFYRQIRDEVLPNISGISAAGLVELKIMRNKVSNAIKLAEKSPNWTVHITAAQRKTIVDRASRSVELFEHSVILWVDDHPENNVNEVGMLQDLKAEVVQVTNNDAALTLFAKRNFDVVLSDISRTDDPTAGLKLAPLLREAGHASVPVILYVGVYEPARGVPPHAFGVTNRPDTMLHLVIDALERRGC